MTNGKCSGLVISFMEIRGLGISNIWAILEANALQTNKEIGLIINLAVLFTHQNITQFDRLDNVFPRVMFLAWNYQRLICK